MSHLVGPLVRPLARMAEHSQRTACRNAMVASTALAQLRREREEVQEYVDDLLARRGSRVVAGDPSLPAAARLG
jgi:hypothetical protein